MIRLYLTYNNNCNAKTWVQCLITILRMAYYNIKFIIYYCCWFQVKISSFKLQYYQYFKFRFISSDLNNIKCIMIVMKCFNENSHLEDMMGVYGWWVDLYLHKLINILQHRKSNYNFCLMHWFIEAVAWSWFFCL